MVILSHLTSPQGQVSTTTPRTDCMNLILNINSAQVVNIPTLPGLSTQFDTLITTDEDYFAGQIAKGALTNGPKKILVKLTSKSPVRKYFYDPQITKFYNISKLVFNNSDCESNLIISNNLSGEGYYEFIHKDIEPPKEQGKQVSFTNQYKNTKAEYEKFKKKLPLSAERKYINLIGNDYKVKLEGLDGSKEEK